MQYKEFQTGLLTTGITQQRLLEETCSEYTLAALEIVNRSANAMRIGFVGGWVSRGAYNDGFANIITNYPVPTATQEANSNVALAVTRSENILASPGGTISANTQGVLVFPISEIQMLYLNLERTAAGDSEVFGILKGAIEGISTTFDTGDVTNAAPSAWIDCRAYSTMSFEVWNTGGGNLTGLFGAKRRHVNIISTATIAFSFTDFFSANPIAIVQQVRASSPNAGTATGRSVIDLNVNDLHSLRFSCTAGQFRIRGVLKG